MHVVDDACGLASCWHLSRQWVDVSAPSGAAPWTYRRAPEAKGLAAARRQSPVCTTPVEGRSSPPYGGNWRSRQAAPVVRAERGTGPGRASGDGRPPWRGNRRGLRGLGRGRESDSKASRACVPWAGQHPSEVPRSSHVTSSNVTSSNVTSPNVASLRWGTTPLGHRPDLISPGLTSPGSRRRLPARRR